MSKWSGGSSKKFPVLGGDVEYDEVWDSRFDDEEFLCKWWFKEVRVYE